MKSRVKNVIRYVSECEVNDLTLDIQNLLKKLNREDRLLLIAVSLGVPIKVLRRYYSANANIRFKIAERKFEDLLTNYMEETHD